MRVGLCQLTSSDDPAENLATVTALLDRADGVDMVLTPEVTNCLSTSRTHQNAVLHPETTDPTLRSLRAAAKRHGLWLLIGSLALRTDDPDGRFANRSLMIDPAGDIRARYDKIHMFDVAVSETETYRESAGYRPGAQAVIAQTPWAKVGLTICYDVRFPHLFRQLSQAGAGIITVPSAFSPTTGAAHWEVLLRARAIETGAFVIAPAQVGIHAAQRGKSRRTYGHSMVVAPWGEVLLDAQLEPGLHVCDLDLTEVAQARARVPSVLCDVPFAEPSGG